MHDGSLLRRRRTIAVSAAALALFIAGAPFLPDDTGPLPQIQPRGSESLTTATAPGSGAVTDEMRAEIERVVAEGARMEVSARASTYDLAIASTRCAVFDGQRYCLGLGWTTKTQEEAAAGFAAPPIAGATEPEETGDLDAVAAMRQRAKLSPSGTGEGRTRRAHGCRTLRREGLADPPRDPGRAAARDFLERHPEAATNARAAQAPRTPAEVQDPEREAGPPAVESYWCGPTRCR